MRPSIDDHDYDVKMRAIKRFFEEGDKVKVTLRFRGREMAHQELGYKLLQRVKGDLVEDLQGRIRAAARRPPDGDGAGAEVTASPVWYTGSNPSLGKPWFAGSREPWQSGRRLDFLYFGILRIGHHRFDALFHGGRRRIHLAAAENLAVVGRLQVEVTAAPLPAFLLLEIASLAAFLRTEAMPLSAAALMYMSRSSG